MNWVTVARILSHCGQQEWFNSASSARKSETPRLDGVVASHHREMISRIYQQYGISYELCELAPRVETRGINQGALTELKNLCIGDESKQSFLVSLSWNLSRILGVCHDRCQPHSDVAMLRERLRRSTSSQGSVSVISLYIRRTATSLCDAYPCIFSYWGNLIVTAAWSSVAPRAISCCTASRRSTKI
jgi:hypothetical protein